MRDEKIYITELQRLFLEWIFERVSIKDVPGLAAVHSRVVEDTLHNGYYNKHSYFRRRLNEVRESLLPIYLNSDYR